MKYLLQHCCLTAWLSVMLLSFSISTQAQESILINLHALDATTLKPVKPLQVINTKNIQRFFGDSLGYAIVQAGKEDTLYATARGYATVLFCYRDSPLRQIYTLRLKMNRISVQLPEVYVEVQRDFDYVHKQAQQLGYNPHDYMLHGYQVLQSPITFLYQVLSTREKDKREYAQLLNEGRKKELVKQLVTNYINLGILALDPADVNAFIDYIEVPDDFLKHMTEYEFIRYLQYQVNRFQTRRIPAPPAPH